MFIPVGRSIHLDRKNISSLDSALRSNTRGSRKTARSIVSMIAGAGQIYVNGKSLPVYCDDVLTCQKIIEPFELSKTLGKFNVWATVRGGGYTGQSEAIAHAIAKGLIIHNPDLEPLLTKCLLADTRQVERKKTGQPKARKKNTWVKR